MLVCKHWASLFRLCFRPIFLKLLWLVFKPTVLHKRICYKLLFIVVYFIVREKIRTFLYRMPFKCILIDDLSHFNGVDHRLRFNIDVHRTDTSTEILSVDFRPALYYLRTGLIISFIQFLFPNFSPLMTKR